MKNVLVTGSTGTLGEEILRLLLKNNYNVIGHYNKNWERAYELEKELGIEFIKCDLTNENDIDNMVNYLINKYEHIDILINNAAFYYDEPLEEKTKDTFMKVLDTNLVGPFLLSREIAKYMLKLFKEGQIDELKLIYTEMEGAMSLIPHTINLLPLQIRDFKVKENGMSDVLDFDPSPEIVFERLTNQYLKGVLYGGMVESFVSEHFARMTAMDNATTNAEKVSKKLTLDYNRARQQSITQEITEIIGGAMNTN